jgi:hypothetical protein
MEVCDCFENSHHISFPDPEIVEAADECAKMQVKVVEDFKGSADKEKLFRRGLKDCVSPVIEKRFKSVDK